MSYRVYRFGDVTLPVLEASHEVGSGPSKMLFLDTPQGQYDLLGDERALRAPVTLPVMGKIFGATAGAVQTQLDTLKGMRGRRERLYRKLSDGSLQWMLARLDSITGAHGSKNSRYLPLTMAFVLLEQAWNGANHDAGWVLDDGEELDYGLSLDSADYLFTLSTSPRETTVANGGNAVVRDAIITLTAGSANITALTIALSANGIDIDFTGTILAGESLIIDTGARSVRNDGVDAYDDFSLASGHNSEDWLPLEPGSNALNVTLTGGSTDSTILYTFCDRWE